MNGKFLKISMALCLVSCMNACDEGEHKNLDCDPDTYQSECLANNSYMFCRNGMLTVMECGTMYVCRETETAGQDGTVTKSAACEPFDDVATECATNADCTDASKPVCSNGTCIAESAPAKECASNDDCKDSSKPVCSADGTCIADESDDKDKTDNTCGEDFVESCDGNSAVYCSGGKVKTLACDEDTVCLVSGTSKIADCYEKDASKDESVCTTVGEKKSSCEALGWYGDVTSTYQCEELSDGSNRFVGIEYDQCDFACNAAGSACAIATEDGQTCMSDATAYCTTNKYESCAIYDGSVMCYSSGDICKTENAVSYACETDYWGDAASVTTTCVRMADGATLVNVAESETCALSCNASDGKCAPITDDGTTCNAAATKLCTDNDYDGCALVGGELTCYLNDDKCSNVGSTSVACDASWASWGVYSSVTNVCTLADDGSTKLYVYEDAEYCDDFCDSATGLCAADEAVEGECSTGETAQCEAYGYEGCEVVDGEAMCHVGTCTLEGHVTNACADYSSYGEGVITETTTCVKADNGKLVMSYAYEECANGCNDTNDACLKLVDDEGQACDENVFTERCDDNVVVYCYNSVVTAFSCDELSEEGVAATCYVSSAANYSDCYAEAELETLACTIPSSRTECDDATYKHAALLTYSCAEFKTADGSKTENLYYMTTGEYCVNDAETAYTVCNEDNTACSDEEESDE